MCPLKMGHKDSSFFNRIKMKENMEGRNPIINCISNRFEIFMLQKLCRLKLCYLTFKIVKLGFRILLISNYNFIAIKQSIFVFF